jgi:hypothetical protein
MPLNLGEGVQDPGHLDEMGLVVPVEGVDLAGDEKSQETQMAGSAHSGI